MMVYNISLLLEWLLKAPTYTKCFKGSNACFSFYFSLKMIYVYIWISMELCDYTSACIKKPNKVV